MKNLGNLDFSDCNAANFYDFIDSGVSDDSFSSAFPAALICPKRGIAGMDSRRNMNHQNSQDDRRNRKNYQNYRKNLESYDKRETFGLDL